MLDFLRDQVDPRRFLERRGNFIRAAWETLSPLPGGKQAFSALIARLAPYTGTIRATVLELERTRALLEMKDRPSLRNHLGSIHAIALANLAELSGNIALAYGLPDDARFIVLRLEIDYLKKARGTLHAEGRAPLVSDSSEKEVEVEVEIRNSQGERCAQAKIRSLVGPKKGK
ncbi:MAG: DUF4442 domain-containing protein [Sandaracinaceae bacterium]|nr:DUF4442 domain-containing protein [Sandaracinaceae bacterium]MDW8245885.1 DUF4442 domain-containing protein [Sandaracinaceae bacterium]